MKKLLALLILVLGQISVYAVDTLEEVKPRDTILIVAPHPDDAVLAAGGLIQRALKKRARVKIVYITSGKHNLASLILYEKFILKRKKGALSLGRIRREEAKQATRRLGLKNNDLIFLDYPDSGILNIFKNHWNNDSPFRDSLTKATQLGKEEGISSCSLYKGENILRDLKRVILKIKPNKIFAPSPYDKNRDHIGSYLFLRLTLLDIENKMPMPHLYFYVVHRGGLSIIERYRPKDYFNLDKEGGSKEWKILKLSDDEINIKKEAILKFKSQMYCKKFLLSFANDELFQEKECLTLVNDKPLTLYLYNRKNKPIAKMSMSIKNNFLRINIIFAGKNSPRYLRGRIYLFGYRNNKIFGNMPKIYLSFRADKWNLYIRNKKIPRPKGASFIINRYSSNISIPMHKLFNPQRLFMHTNIFSELDTMSAPWQIIDIKPMNINSSQD